VSALELVEDTTEARVIDSFRATRSAFHNSAVFSDEGFNVTFENCDDDATAGSFVFIIDGMRTKEHDTFDLRAAVDTFDGGAVYMDFFTVPLIGEGFIVFSGTSTGICASVGCCDEKCCGEGEKYFC